MKARTVFLGRARAVLAEHQGVGEPGRGQSAPDAQRPADHSLGVHRACELRPRSPVPAWRFCSSSSCSTSRSRRAAPILAAVATIYLSVVWTVGVMGILHIPIQGLTQTTPIIVSDHLDLGHRAHRPALSQQPAAGIDARQALARQWPIARCPVC